MAGHEDTMLDIASRVRNGERSAEDVIRETITGITAANDELNAFIHIAGDDAIARARAIDAALSRGEDAGPLAGVPIAVKDNMHVVGMPTTCGSKMLASMQPPFPSTAVSRLEAAGAVVVGKTNLDEFAMGSSTENSAFGPTRNPWDTERAPGGSSGGSAAAVGAGLVPCALGSDTGGSIRQPASFCSVTGFKPSYGAVSRYGLVAFGSSLDQIGPFTRSAADAAVVTRLMAGIDSKDSTSADREFGETQPSPSLEGVTLGLPEEFLGPEVADDVRAVIENALEELRGAGAKVLPVTLPHTRYAIPVYYVLATSEASSNLARFDGVAYGHRAANASTLEDLFERSRTEGFGPEVTRRIMLGTFALSSGYYDAYYDRALRVRTLIAQDYATAFREVDAIIGPTSPFLPFKLGEKVDDPLAMYLSDILTVPANLAGLPGISIPAGHADGLPVGLQILGRVGEDTRILDHAAAFQSVTDHHLEVPR